MNSTGRTVGIVVGVVALSLAAVGIVLAATDSNSRYSSSASLDLHGQPPSTAELTFTVDAGQRYKADGTIDINFLPSVNRAKLVAHIPLVFSTLDLTAIFANNHLYAMTPSTQSGSRRSWVALPVMTPDFSKVANALAHPDLAHIEDVIGAGPPTSTTTSGSFTTYTFTKTLGSAKLTGHLKKSLPSSATITYAVTVASENQIADFAVNATAGSFHAVIDIHVVSYNQPVSINVPPHNEIRILKPGDLRGVISGETPITSLLPSGTA